MTAAGHPNRRLVRFDEAFDGGAWPGPLGAGERIAAFGEDWVGRLGLLSLLETELGLTGAYPSSTERAADLCRRLESEDGFWRDSYEADRLGTCRRLLSDRDTLVLSGWTGQPLSLRLDEVWRVTSGAMTGMADRLRNVCDALETLPTQIGRVTVSPPLAARPLLWRQVFDALASQGAAIDEEALPDVATVGDLAGARSKPFEPRGDGRLVIRRPHGVLAAAEEVAAALAASPSRERIVIIGADSILDAALHRHGLPRLGAASSKAGSSALVRLVLETAFEPTDPADLHALLCADPGPIPRGLAWRLTGALRSCPGRGAPDWAEALAKGLAKLPEERREPLEQRVRALVEPLAKRDETLSLERLRERLRHLVRWARGRVDDEPSLVAVLESAERIVRLAELMGEQELGRDELRRLCDESAPSGVRGPAEAGLSHGRSPGGVYGPADVIVWWNFTRASAPTMRQLRLSNAEKRAIREAGMAVPSAASEMVIEALGWRRPLTQATRALLLVCPQTDESGEPSYPHPLWDELCALMEDAKDATLLEADRISFPHEGRQRRADLRPVPVAQTAIRAPSRLPLRERESPSSLETLLGCSFQWALRYHAKLRHGMSAGPPGVTPLLYGKLAHKLIADVFGEGRLMPDAAAERAEAVFEAQLPRLAESLELPRYQGERATLKRAVVESAQELARLIEELDADIAGVEHDVEGAPNGLPLGGRLDLLLRNPDIVIDLKWGAWTNRNLLKNGAALQLAAYAELCKQGPDRPSIAYFVLSSQTVMTVLGSVLRADEYHGTADAAEIWDGAMSALEARRAELSTGSLVAPGADGDETESVLLADRLVVAPSCDYCDFGGICGLRAGR